MKFEPLPSRFRDVRVWGAKAQGRSFIVTKQDGFGFTASWNDCGSLTPGPAKLIAETPFASLRQAVTACRRFARVSLQ